MKATGYITDAEKQKQAAVFSQTPITLSNGGNLRQDIHGKHQTAKMVHFLTLMNLYAT